MTGHEPTGAERVLRIDCADCAHRHTEVCDDCLVTFLCAREDDGAVVVPIAEVRAVRLLQDRGLAPRNRHRPTVGAAPAPDRTGGDAGGVDRSDRPAWTRGRPA